MVEQERRVSIRRGIKYNWAVEYISEGPSMSPLDNYSVVEFYMFELSARAREKWLESAGIQATVNPLQ